MTDVRPPPPADERRQTIVAPPNNLPYIVAVVTMMLLGVVGIVSITMIRPNADNTTLIGLILGFLAPTTLSLLAFMKSQETHLSVNSRLDAFMANAKLAAHAVGVNEGRAEGLHQANVRTDSLAAAGEASVAKLLTNVEARADVLSAGERLRAVPATAGAGEPVKVEVVNSPLVVEEKKTP